MPAWDDFDTLTEDPQNEMSLIYYPNRGGIEDRVFRIKTDRSSATSLPEPRTEPQHLERRGAGRDGAEIRVRFNWMTLSTTATGRPTATGARRSTPSMSAARRSSPRRRSSSRTTASTT
jgi:3-phenylpropionate/cinnamic acid dioxygenase small subunit